MATCAIAPILAMITYHGYENTVNFLFPIIPSLAVGFDTRLFISIS